MCEFNKINTSEYLTPVSYESTKTIIEAMEKCICKISYKNQSIGIGFFCKIQLAGQKEPLKYLITNNHILNEKILNKDNKCNEQISIVTRYEQNKPKNIQLNQKARMSLCNNKLGITMIEIKDSDNIKYFLETDTNNLNKPQKYYNINKQVYMIHNNDNNIYVSYGIINNEYAKSNYFMHTCNSFQGSSGFPIINIENHKVIGINKENNRGFFINFFGKISSIDSINKIYEGVARHASSEDLSLKMKFTNDIDISNKRGLINLDSEQIPCLNSIFQMLTSIKEIKDFINPFSDTPGENKINDFKRFDHIYTFTSFFQKALDEIYQTDKLDENVSLKQMCIILKFLNKDIYKKNIYDLLFFILNTLHEELISYPDNIPRIGNLISFHSDFNELEQSKMQFYNYYNSHQYFSSLISNLFNWIRREQRECSFDNTQQKQDGGLKCRKSYFSLQAFPIVLFDLDELNQFAIDQNLYRAKDGKSIDPSSSTKTLDLDSCFNIYYLLEHKLDNQTEKCIYCNNGGLSSHFSIEISPKYFIIVINRKENIEFSYKEDLELTQEEGNLTKSYELISVIIEERDNWSCITKNCDYINAEKNECEQWIKFQDENTTMINISKINKCKNKDIFDNLNARILLYKEKTIHYNLVKDK